MGCISLTTNIMGLFFAMGRLVSAQDPVYSYIHYNPSYENYPWIYAPPTFDYRYIVPGYSLYPYYPGQPYYPENPPEQPIYTPEPKVTTRPTPTTAVPPTLSEVSIAPQPTTPPFPPPTNTEGIPVWPTGSSKTTVPPVPRWPTGPPTKPPSIQVWPTGETPATYPTTPRTTTPVWPTGRAQTVTSARHDWPTGRPGMTRPPSIPVWPTATTHTEPPVVTIPWPTAVPNGKPTTSTTAPKWPTGMPYPETKVTTPATTAVTAKWPTGPPGSGSNPKLEATWPTRRPGVTRPPLPEWPTHVAIMTPPTPLPVWPTRSRNESPPTTLPPSDDQTTTTPSWPTRRPKSKPAAEKELQRVKESGRSKTDETTTTASTTTTTTITPPEREWRTTKVNPSEPHNRPLNSAEPQHLPKTNPPTEYPEQYPIFPFTEAPVYIPLQTTSSTTPWPTYIVPTTQPAPAIYREFTDYYIPEWNTLNYYNTWTGPPLTSSTTTPTQTPTTTTKPPPTTTISIERCKKLCLDETGRRQCCKNKVGECPERPATCPSQRNKRQYRKKAKRQCFVDTQCVQNYKCCLDHCDEESYCTRVIFGAQTK